MSNSLKKGDLYNSFEVLNVFDVSDYHSQAIHLRHNKTGLEVFHLLNDDSENLFAFAFRTPNPKANGLAHIIEHSVLCGSEKYPLKDPFVIMSNQSVKTYLNAMTYADKTVYPASSIAKTDYFNLMSVYGDAVFFPRLDREVFMQEAHRLEVDDKGNVSIQGVVYNEMKGSYSSFESVASDISLASVFPSSIYQKDSGGDPLEIPGVSYEEFLDFHKRWYRPDNCLVFLNGNIPTEEQLDFLQENFLNRLEKKFPHIDISEAARKKRIEEFISMVKPKEISEPLLLRAEGPSGDGEDSNTVLVNWNLGLSENALSATEKVVLAGILVNHDGSPLQKALVESNLGQDLAPQNGIFSALYNSIFTIGLRGVKEGDENKVLQLVMDTLQNLVKNGISKKDIESTLVSLEFSHREIKRGYGPFALSLMSRPIYGWLYGESLENQIRLRCHLEKIRSKIEEDDSYLPSLLTKLFLKNNNRSLVVVAPSKDYTKKRDEAEKKYISDSLKKITKEEIKLQNEKLHAYQQKNEDETCLPHLSPADFIVDGRPVMNRCLTEVDFLQGCHDSKLPYVKNVENTNGIIYFDLAFPVDVLSPQDYPLIPAFSDCVTECGWKNLDWAHAAEECALHTGGIGVGLLTMQGPDTKKSREMRSKYKWIGRDWLVFRMASLEEECENALKLLEDCVSGVDFSDEKRILDILTESRNDFEASVIPDGHIFVSSRVVCQKSKKSAVDEIWNGLSQYFSIKKIASAPVKETVEKFRRIFKSLKNGGALIHVTAEENGFKILSNHLPAFISNLDLHAPVDAAKYDDSEFYALTQLDGQVNSKDNPEIFTTSSQIGYAAEAIPAAFYGSQESCAEEVCSHWLSNNLLWEKIRTIGGAYGAFATAESMGGFLIFASYRDPNFLNSCSEFEKCLKEAKDFDFSEDEVTAAIMGCYSHFIQPQAPKVRGSTAFTRLLYGISDEDRERKILGILSLKADDVKAAFKRLYDSCSNEDFKKNAIICGKNSLSDQVISGKIVSLPL